jgi:hypothetical protein
MLAPAEGAGPPIASGFFRGVVRDPVRHRRGREGGRS